jgi:hypothetical protein
MKCISHLAGFIFLLFTCVVRRMFGKQRQRAELSSKVVEYAFLTQFSSF